MRLSAWMLITASRSWSAYFMQKLFAETQLRGIISSTWPLVLLNSELVSEVFLLGQYYLRLQVRDPPIVRLSSNYYNECV